MDDRRSQDNERGCTRDVHPNRDSMAVVDESQRSARRIRLRTITLFANDIMCSNSLNILSEKLKQHYDFLEFAKAEFVSRLGLEIQTVRLSTGVLRSICDFFYKNNRGSMVTLEHHLHSDGDQIFGDIFVIRKTILHCIELEALATEIGFTFLSLGTMPTLLADVFLRYRGALTALAASLKISSFSVPFVQHSAISSDGKYFSRYRARRIAEEILFMGGCGTKGATFRFGVSFNCDSKQIPFFPCSSADQNVVGFALGCENNQLLDYSFSQAMEDTSEFQGTESSMVEYDGADLNSIMEVVASIFTAELIPVQAVANEISKIWNSPSLLDDAFLESNKVEYFGIDSSIVPSLDPPTIPASFQKLGICEYFGGCGTLAIAERLTAVLKTLPLKLTGYCGLMLPVCEDLGLASAVTAKQVSLSSLLQYSAVCGVGLDTVPIPGISLDQEQLQSLKSYNTNCNKIEKASEQCLQIKLNEEISTLANRVTAIILDVSALSNRLNKKPLSVRLLPVPGRAPGDISNFENPYLVDACIMEI